ncbi:hypothetical protein EAF00_008595 [Botryotinia globosa]|nr:hypothetical protein EAF00_008595 [Botryotinia globosa]
MPTTGIEPMILASLNVNPIYDTAKQDVLPNRWQSHRNRKLMKNHINPFYYTMGSRIEISKFPTAECVAQRFVCADKRASKSMDHHAIRDYKFPVEIVTALREVTFRGTELQSGNDRNRPFENATLLSVRKAWTYYETTSDIQAFCMPGIQRRGLEIRIEFIVRSTC